jgi:hypothetical protein
MDMEKPIQLTFAYSYDDWQAAYRLYYSQSRQSKTDKIFAVFFFLVGCWLFYDRYLVEFQQFLFWGLWDFVLPAFFFFAGFIAWFDLITLFGMRRRWHRRYGGKPAASRSPYEFTFGEESARYTSRGVDVKVTWEEFGTFIENEQMVLLLSKHDRNSYWMVPKRHFPDSDDLESFHTLIERKLGYRTKVAR